MVDGSAQPPPPAPTTGPSAPAPPAHEPFMRRLRKAGRDPTSFRNRARTWLYAGVAALVVLALLPIAVPGSSVLTERVATLLSLVFLMASIGLWLGMRGRAFVVASAFVSSL